MSFYLDTNFIVAVLTPEPFSTRAQRFLSSHPESMIVSDFAALEFSSVIARQVRVGERPRAEASIILSQFDAWCAQSADRLVISPDDVALADTYLRRLDLTLLAPDAIHIAVVQGSGAILATFDRAMAVAARRLGVPVARV